jgi:thiol-disulfide isomerase/thioredoxin
MTSKHLLLALLACSLSMACAQDLATIDKTFEKKLTDTRNAVLKDKVKAIEKFLKDPKTKDHADVPKALQTAAETCVEVEMWKEARQFADQLMARVKEGEQNLDARVIAGRAAIKAKGSADEVKTLMMPAIEKAELKQKSVDRAITAANALGDFLLESGDKKAAEEVWDKLKVAISHPQIHAMADNAIKKIEIMGKPPTAFSVKDLAGNDLSPEKLKGKVVLIDFWATWCPPCVAEMPNVIETYKKLHDQGFEIIGISLDKEREKLDEFLKENQMPWPQFFDGQGWKNEIAVLYGVQSIPATYLIDRNGNVARMDVSGEELRKAVEELLAKKS